MREGKLYRRYRLGSLKFESLTGSLDARSIQVCLPFLIKGVVPFRHYYDKPRYTPTRLGRTLGRSVMKTPDYKSLPFGSQTEGWRDLVGPSMFRPGTRRDVLSSFKKVEEPTPRSVG